ncbi:hypothetical protein CDEST_05266 [Colletotrichum destructivum]|uniref:Uncharacterized protein n=1 Tax=Colletotrichum destructivum TaxID=34406 RepID=A0AAX4IAM8_9PEZI|nr:hypothetical protein CDEST_05266 [Colletotrichum destructivum]
MSGSETETFPLESVTNAQLQQLGEALWSWKPRSNGTSQSGVVTTHLRPDLTKFGPYFQYYREMTASYISDAFPPEEIKALRSHDDLLAIINLIRSNPDTQRSELTTKYFSSRQIFEETPPEDKQRAFNLAMRVLMMISCSSEGLTDDLLPLGTESSIWRRDQSAREFVSGVFSTRNHPSLNEVDESLPNIQLSLRAVGLKKVAHLSFHSTDDLRNHLRLDPRTGVVEIFHHTTFLKESLKASKNSAEQCILPRQLALETLDSLQKVLFPPDKDSRALLRSLVSKASFDPDCLCLSSVSYRSNDERDLSYHYWGSRLMDLYDELENPRPRGLIDIWLEQRSKARHVMLATLVGVVIAVVLGMLGLVVGIFQAWVAYQAWKHPVNV